MNIARINSPNIPSFSGRRGSQPQYEPNDGKTAQIAVTAAAIAAGAAAATYMAYSGVTPSSMERYESTCSDGSTVSSSYNPGNGGFCPNGESPVKTERVSD